MSSITNIKNPTPSDTLSDQIREIAEYYSRTPGRPFPDQTGFQRWIAQQYHRLPLPIEYVDYDPYRSLEHMNAETASSGRLRITRRNNESIFDPSANLMFRAVHDHDHLRHRCDFGAFGEICACRVISNRCGDELGRALLFSEIIGQACVALVNGEFDDQKFVWFPRRTRDRMLAEA